MTEAGTKRPNLVHLDKSVSRRHAARRPHQGDSVRRNGTILSENGEHLAQAVE